MNRVSQKSVDPTPDRGDPDPLDFRPPAAVPTHFRAFVPRPELVSRLSDAGGYPLVLVTAPPGYGKTTLLAEWSTEDDRDFAWVTLDSRHDHPSRLLNRLVKALDSVGSGGRSFVLVIDDAHVIRTKAAQSALASTIESLPKEGQIALSSRKEPALSLGRMRAHREVFELTRRDLAMTRAESAALLEGIGLELDSEEVDSLHKLTEGWPAALYLAVLSLGGEGEPHADVAGFGGDDRFVADYLRDEFLAGISVARLRFLIRTSILEDLTGQICDDVLERSGSARVLRELSRSQLPLEALDHADGSYRYHPLLAQMLRAELHRREPDVEKELHGRASAWYGNQEDFEPAIDHALAASDEKRAGHLIWARAAPSLAKGDRAAVRHWLDRFSDGKIASSPQLALSAAHLYLALGEGELGLHWASVADEGFDEESLEDPELLADLLTLRATLPQHGIERMGEDATRAGQLHPPESPWRSISGFYAGAARLLLGDTDGARELLEEGARRGAATGPLAHVFCLSQLTMLHLDCDDLESALRTAGHAREQVERFKLGVYPVMAIHFAGASLAHARDRRIEDALADRRRATELLSALNHFPGWFLAEIRIFLARASLILDDAGTAKGLLGEAALSVDQVVDAPTLERWLAESDSTVSTKPADAGGGGLTPAELRTLQFLPSHLSFREIASESFVSANTVKTQAQAIYRKLDASSRAEAVERARERGLLSDGAHG